MELIYTWIKEWGPFENADINFGGEYFFSYDNETHYLKISDNPSYTENFFNETLKNNRVQITNVTAIVGANGAGKTMLLDFIKENLGSLWCEESIFIFSENGEIILHHNLGRATIIEYDKTSIDIDITPHGKPEKGEFLEGVMGYKTGIQELIDKTEIIFFSNIADLRNEEKYPDLRNISTNFLLKSDKKDELKKQLCDEKKSEIAIHKERDMKRQIYFIDHYKKSKEKFIDFTLPDKISINPRVNYLKTNNEIILNSLKDKIGENTDLFRFVQEIIKQMRNSLHSSFKYRMRERLEVLNTNLLCNLFLHILQELCVHFYVPDSIRKLKTDDLIEQNYNFKIIVLLDRLKNINIEDKKYKSWIRGASELIKRLDEIILLHGKEKDMTIVLPYNVVLSLIEIHRKSYLVDENLLFNWRDISSGEKALLNIFARLHSLSDSEQNAENMKLKNDIILLIDEGDIYLHPRWQQEFLKKLLDFLVLDYASQKGKKRNIQIILTTNQPIIASDLPKNNVVFINRSNENKCKIVESKKKKETFGANIHYLLADTFFLNDSYIGSFAKQKIDKLVKLVANEEEINEETKKNAEKLIKMIGEPIVKNKLLQMLKYKLSNNSQKE